MRMVRKWSNEVHTLLEGPDSRPQKSPRQTFFRAHVAVRLPRGCAGARQRIDQNSRPEQ